MNEKLNKLNSVTLVFVHFYDKNKNEIIVDWNDYIFSGFIKHLTNITCLDNVHRGDNEFYITSFYRFSDTLTSYHLKILADDLLYCKSNTFPISKLKLDFVDVPNHGSFVDLGYTIIDVEPRNLGIFNTKRRTFMSDEFNSVFNFDDPLPLYNLNSQLSDLELLKYCQNLSLNGEKLIHQGLLHTIVNDNTFYTSTLLSDVELTR